jgi:CO/xanthine dehydrogenase FAD-binding subunit
VHEKLTVRVNAGVVNCSAAVQVAEDGTLADVGIALGAVERQPVRGRAAEDVLLGQRPEGEVLDEAAWAAVAELHPGTDARGDAEFRRAAAAALLKRAVRGAYRQATEKVSA